MVSKTKVEIYCPPIASYSQEFKEQLIGELESLPRDGTALQTIAADYITLRDKVRACEVERDKRNGN